MTMKTSRINSRVLVFMGMENGSAVFWLMAESAMVNYRINGADLSKEEELHRTVTSAFRSHGWTRHNLPRVGAAVVSFDKSSSFAAAAIRLGTKVRDWDKVGDARRAWRGC